MVIKALAIRKGGSARSQVLHSVFTVRVSLGFSSTTKSNQENRQKRAGWFLTCTCACSVLLTQHPVGYLYSNPRRLLRGWVLCVPPLPLVWLCSPHMLGTAILNMCIKSRKHPSYCACADELLHAARALSARRSRPAAQEAAASSFCTTCFPARGKERLAQTFGEHQPCPHAARPQAAVTSAGAGLPAGSCPRYGAAATDPERLAPALLLEGTSGVLSWGTEGPSGCTLSTFPAVISLRVLHRKKKMSLRSRGHFNKHLTLSVSSSKSVKLLVCLIINICVGFCTVRFQTCQRLTSSQLRADDLKLRSVFRQSNVQSTWGSKNKNIQRNCVFQGWL